MMVATEGSRMKNGEMPGTNNEPRLLSLWRKIQLTPNGSSGRGGITEYDVYQTLSVMGLAKQRDKVTLECMAIRAARKEAEREATAQKLADEVFERLVPMLESLISRQQKPPRCG